MPYSLLHVGPSDMLESRHSVYLHASKQRRKRARERERERERETPTQDSSKSTSDIAAGTRDGLGSLGIGLEEEQHFPAHI